MKTRGLIHTLVPVACLAIGAGLVLLLRPTSSPVHRRGKVAELTPEVEGRILDLCRDLRRGIDVGLLTRSNSHAAAAMVRLRTSQTAARSIMTCALGGRDPEFAFGVLAVQLGPDPSAIVLMCVDEEDRLVHYSHPVDPAIIQLGCEFGARLSWLPINRQSLASLGTLREDGIVYVETSVFEKERDKIRVPDGEVVVGLKYPDGTYSNFILLEQWGSGTPY